MTEINTKTWSALTIYCSGGVSGNGVSGSGSRYRMNTVGISRSKKIADTKISSNAEVVSYIVALAIPYQRDQSDTVPECSNTVSRSRYQVQCYGDIVDIEPKRIAIPYDGYSRYHVIRRYCRYKAIIADIITDIVDIT